MLNVALWDELVSGDVDCIYGHYGVMVGWLCGNFVAPWPVCKLNIVTSRISPRAHRGYELLKHLAQVGLFCNAVVCNKLLLMHHGKLPV